MGRGGGSEGESNDNGGELHFVWLGGLFCLDLKNLRNWMTW
jgi:hypothetical protein